MNELPKLLSRDVTEQIVRRILGFVDQPGTTRVEIVGWWNGELRWARNRVSLASERRDITVHVHRSTHGAGGDAYTNQLDDVSLKAAVQVAERSAQLVNKIEIPASPLRPPVLPTPKTKIWSDATYKVTAAQRAELANMLTGRAEEKDLMSAGYVEIRAGEVARLDPWSSEPDKVTYDAYTQAQCSVTVRHPKGVGSGWAGLSGYDWTAIDSPALAERALEKCVASLNPVAIEPGRYTTILEPQAVADLLEGLMMVLQSRSLAEQGRGPFALSFDRSLRLWMTKLGLKIVDERISITHDPLDPLLGVLPEQGLSATNWIERGVLKTMSYGRGYALTTLNDNMGDLPRPAYRVSGGETSMDEMISSTKRGILVTRLVNLRIIEERSLLMTGLTRDGLWLIENGKISKAIKNLRFTESPLFMLNQVEQLGPAVPVFRPVRNPYSPGISGAIVPPIKANDFSFTATVDAV